MLEDSWWLLASRPSASTSPQLLRRALPFFFFAFLGYLPGPIPTTFPRGLCFFCLRVLDLATEHPARIDLPSCGCPRCRVRSSRPLLGRRRHRMMPTSRVFRYAHLQHVQSWNYAANSAYSCERTRCNRFVATTEVHHVRIRSTILITT